MVSETGPKARFPHLDALLSWAPALRRSLEHLCTAMPLLYCLGCQRAVDEVVRSPAGDRCLACVLAQD